MQRPWAVRPDQADGTLSREGLIGALVDAATMLDIAGGCLEVVVGRAPTDVPGEMVMTSAMLCWKDRTDAKPQREPSVQVVAEPEPLPEPKLSAAAHEAIEAEQRAITQAVRDGVDVRVEAGSLKPEDPKIDPDDGFNYGQMPDEDVEGADESLALRS